MANMGETAWQLDRRTLLAGAGTLIATLPSALFAAGPSTLVEAPAGRFSGTVDAGVQAFRGIRYGRAERFQAPTRETPIREIVRAENFGPVAPQKDDRRQRRLPVSQYLDCGHPSRGEEAGDGLYPWRRLFERQQH
jgi:hypothetical protein